MKKRPRLERIADEGSDGHKPEAPARGKVSRCLRFGLASIATPRRKAL
jgi:hypothetical protein